MTDGGRFKPRMRRRIPVDFQTSFICGEVTGTGMAIDMSSGGMMLKTKTELEIGNAIDLKIGYSEGAEPLELQGEIKYSKDSDEEGILYFGVIFDDSQAEAISKLKRIIYDARFSTKFFRRMGD